MVTRINIFSLIALLSLLGNSNLSAMEDSYSSESEFESPCEAFGDFFEEVNSFLNPCMCGYDSEDEQEVQQGYQLVPTQQEFSQAINFQPIHIMANNIDNQIFNNFSKMAIKEQQSIPELTKNDLGTEVINGRFAVVAGEKIFTQSYASKKEDKLLAYDGKSLEKTNIGLPLSDNIENLMGTENYVCCQNEDLKKLYIHKIGENSYKEICFSKANALSSAVEKDGELYFLNDSRKLAKFDRNNKFFEEITDFYEHTNALTVYKNMLIAGQGNGLIKILDKRGKNLSEHTGAVLAFETINGTLFSGSTDKTISAWDLKEKKHLATMKGHTDSVEALKATNDGNLLFSGSLDKTIGVWNPKTFQQLGKILVGHYVFNLQVSSDKLLASGNWVYPKTSVFSRENIKEQLKIKG